MPARLSAFTAMVLAGQSMTVWAQAGELSSAAAHRLEHRTLFEAPIGHRQPTLGDLPPWLRQQETTGSGSSNAPASPATDDMQRREPSPNGGNATPGISPADGVPQICNDC